jgi:hypothetical protein
MAHKLLQNEAGTPDSVYTSGVSQNHDGQVRTIFCWGTFGEAQVDLEYAPSPEGPWFEDQTGESTFTFNDMRTVRFAAGIWMRAKITGATVGTRLNLSVFS